MMTTVTRSGGCLCGAIRYEVAWPPLETVICHCRNCQKQAGTALSVVSVFPRAALSLTGSPLLFLDKAASGREVRRIFCGDCGSPVLTDTAAAEESGIIFVKAGTLDDSTGLDPARHYWTDSAQDWVSFDDGRKALSQQ